MRVIVSRLCDWCVVIALAIALTSVGFAHRTTTTVKTPELAAYIAAGGQPSDICGTSDEDGLPDNFDCEACRIADNFVQPVLSCVVYTELAETIVLAFVAKHIAERNDLDPARLSRAPPQA